MAEGRTAEGRTRGRGCGPRGYRGPVRRRQLLLPLLRTPVLHRTVSRRFLVVEAVDGVDVDPAVVRYAPHDGALVAVTDPAEAWVLGVDHGTAVAVTLGADREGMTASRPTGEAMDEPFLRYLQKYPGEWRALGVEVSATPDEVEAAARRMAVIELRPTGG